MTALRVAVATAALIVCATPDADSGAILDAQYGPPQRTEPSDSARDRPVPSERDVKNKERTLPPRPIVRPEGQQENPALREDCAWLGQRIVSLLFRDDPMTGNDFMPFYSRFGCPEEHLNKVFGCVVKNGNDENDALADRVAQCWLDPSRHSEATAPAGEKGSEVTAPATDTEPKSDDSNSQQPAAPAAKSKDPARQTERRSTDEAPAKPANGGAR